MLYLYVWSVAVLYISAFFYRLVSCCVKWLIWIIVITCYYVLLHAWTFQLAFIPSIAIRFFFLHTCEICKLEVKLVAGLVWVASHFFDYWGGALVTLVYCLIEYLVFIILSTFLILLIICAMRVDIWLFESSVGGLTVSFRLLFGYFVLLDLHVI